MKNWLFFRQLGYFQTILDIRKGKYKNRERGKLVFLGFARCLKCDAAFTGEVKKSRHNHIYHYYRCSNPKCEAQKKVISEANFIRLWSPAIKDLHYPPEMVELFRNILLEHHKRELEMFQENVRELNRQHEELTTKLHAAYDDKIKGLLPSDMFNEIFQKFQIQRQEIETQLRGLTAADDEYIEFGATLIETTANAWFYYENSENLEKKRKLLETILSNPKTDGVNIQFDYRKPFDLLSKIEEETEWWRRVLEF